MWQKALNNGLVGGLVSIALTLIGTLTGIMDPIGGGGFSAGSAIFSILGLAVTVFFIRRAMIQFRDEDNGGVLSFGQGLGVGILTALVMALISAIYLYVHLSMIDPDALNNMQEQVRQGMEDSGMSEEEMEAAEGMTSMFASAPFFAISSVFSSVFVGLIISLIVAAVTKRDAA